MLPDDIQNYLDEIARVLKPGGRCLATFFLLNHESIDLIENGKSTRNFKNDNGIYRSVNQQLPEELLAYDESYVRDMYQKLGLGTHAVYYGWWCGREKYLSYCDLIIATKK
jgi:hypothetical protein